MNKVINFIDDWQNSLRTVVTNEFTPSTVMELLTDIKKRAEEENKENIDKYMELKRKADELAKEVGKITMLADENAQDFEEEKAEMKKQYDELKTASKELVINYEETKKLVLLQSRFIMQQEKENLEAWE